MKSARGHLHWSLVIGIAFAVALLMPTGALASSGEITRAEANAEWTHGSISGSVTWTGCVNAVQPPRPPPPPPPPQPPQPLHLGSPSAPELPYCAWIPYATVGPASSSPDCSSADRRLPGLGEGVLLVWSGGERQGPGSTAFDLPSVSLDGAPGQLLCLSLTEIAQTDKTIPCAPPGEPLPPGWHCPYATASHPISLAEALLVAPSEPEEPPDGEEPPRPGESAVSPKEVGSAKQKRCSRLRANATVHRKPARCHRRRGSRGSHKRGAQN